MYLIIIPMTLIQKHTSLPVVGNLISLVGLRRSLETGFYQEKSISESEFPYLSIPMNNSHPEGRSLLPLNGLGQRCRMPAGNSEVNRPLHQRTPLLINNDDCFSIVHIHLVIHNCLHWKNDDDGSRPSAEQLKGLLPSPIAIDNQKRPGTVVHWTLAVGAD
jgi:hypothetical protein